MKSKIKKQKRAELPALYINEKTGSIILTTSIAYGFNLRLFCGVVLDLGKTELYDNQTFNRIGQIFNQLELSQDWIPFDGKLTLSNTFKK